MASNADPKRTFLKLVDPQQLDDDFKQQVSAIHMDGPAAKVNLVLSEEPRVNGMPADAPVLQKMLFTLVPTFEAGPALLQRLTDRRTGTGAMGGLRVGLSA